MTVNPHINKALDGTGFALFRYSLGCVISGGDSLIVRMNWISQVTKLTSFVTGASATGLITEWRYTQNPLATDYSAWEAPTTGSLEGATIDPDKPLFVELKFTNSGGSAVKLLNGRLSFEYDETATATHGMPTFEGIYQELPELINQFALTFAPKRMNGNPCFQFVNGSPDQCTPNPALLTLYVDQVAPEEGFRTVADKGTQSVFAQIGVRRECNSEQEPYFLPMLGAIKHRLGYSSGGYLYDVVLNGVQHLGVNPNYFFRHWSVTGDADRTPPGDRGKCGCTWKEMFLEVRREFENIALTNF